MLFKSLVNNFVFKPKFVNEIVHQTSFFQKDFKSKHCITLYNIKTLLETGIIN